MKYNRMLLVTSLSFVLSFSSFTMLFSTNADAASKSFNFSESTSQTQTHTVTLPNLKSVTSVTANTGSASVQSINGDNATFRLTGGNASRTVQTGGTPAGSYTQTDSQTSTSNSFASSIYYNSGGYSGYLYKSGTVTSRNVETGGYWQDTGYWQETGYYESTGYWQETGYYQNGGYYKTETVWNDPVWVCQTGANGKPTGYCDWEYGTSTVQVWVPTQTWVSTGQTWVSTGSYWVSTGSSWVNTGSQWVPTYTTYYTQNYSGTVSKPDTRTYQYYYQYNITVNYVDNSAPVVNVTNTSQTASAMNGYNVITLQGTVSDVDNDNITISASVNGKSKSTTVSTTSTAKNWTLSWNVANDNLAQGNYSNIPVTANDGKGGTATATYTGTITVDRTKPTVTFTPEMIEPSFKDLEVQLNITDTGGTGFKQVRYAWSKKEEITTEGWSEWEATQNPLMKQEKGGKWYLHIEAEDLVGNVTYTYSGIYDKIVLSGGPSVTINVFPTPTGIWYNKPIDVYVMESGDAELLAKATKTYEVTNSSLYPSELSKTIPSDKKIQLSLLGENFVHVQYILDDGTKISSTAGPFLIDTGAVGDFEMKLTNVNGNEVTDWTKENLRLVLTDPLTASVSGYQKQYRIEGYHTDWQTYSEGMTINVEGEHRIFGRIVNKTGIASPQKTVIAQIDQTNPNVLSLKLIKSTQGTYEVQAKVADDLSGIHSLQLDNGTLLTEKNGIFVASGLSAKPSHITVQDKAGNNLSTVSFAAEPVITFKAPYTPNLEVYKEDVVVQLAGATGYLIGNRGYACSTDPCQVILSANTTLTAVFADGVKETRTAIKIENIDKTNVQLLLSGKRNASNSLNLEFAWNPTLSNGTLSCTEDGNTVNYPVTGSSFSLNGKNYTYNCTLTGTYKGQTLTSNTIVIYSDGKLPTDGTNTVPLGEVTTNVYIMETKVGKGYIINAKSDNYKYNEMPIPQNEITKD